MLLGRRPLRVRIEAEGPEGAEFLARAENEGLTIVGPGEEADLIARPVGPVAALPPVASAPLASALSRRELEIMDYLVDGWSNAEIASALGIGQRTVRFHLEGIFGKLGVSRRGEAVREAVRLGLVRFEA